ncbi:FCD domain protein [compost metagenome]
MTPLLHEAVNDQHDEIVDAISRREPAQAAAAMARHIEVAQAMIADHLLPRTEIGVPWMMSR